MTFVPLKRPPNTKCLIKALTKLLINVIVNTLTKELVETTDRNFLIHLMFTFTLLTDPTQVLRNNYTGRGELTKLKVANLLVRVTFPNDPQFNIPSVVLFRTLVIVKAMTTI